jgi:hypothetical protein
MAAAYVRENVVLARTKIKFLSVIGRNDQLAGWSTSREALDGRFRIEIHGRGIGYTGVSRAPISPITFTAYRKSLFLKRFLHPVMCEKAPLSA